MIIVNPNLPHMSLESGQPLEELRHRWWTPQHACTVYCWPSLAAHQGDKSCTYRGKQLINKLRKWLIHKFYTRTSKSCSHCMGRPLSVKRALTERRGNRITSTCLGLTVSTQGPSESWQICIIAIHILYHGGSMLVILLLRSSQKVKIAWLRGQHS